MLGPCVKSDATCPRWYMFHITYADISMCVCVFFFVFAKGK